MTSPQLQLIGTNTSNHGYEELGADTYTAHRLKHASAKHLNHTTHRFFIGPIPEGWLNSHRKSWYKRRLQLNNYSSRGGSFSAADSKIHHRTLTGLEGPSTAARLSFSFPQPSDVEDEDGNISAPETDDEAGDIEAMTTEIEPVATNASIPRILGIVDEEDAELPKTMPVPADNGLQPFTESQNSFLRPSRLYPSRSSGQDTFRTAQEGIAPDELEDTGESRRGPDVRSGVGSEDFALQSSVSNLEGSVRTVSPSRNASPYPGQASSTTALLPRENGVKRKGSRPAPSRKSLSHHEPTPVDGNEADTPHIAGVSTGVRFAEDVINRQDRMKKRLRGLQSRAPGRRFRRNTLRDGAIVKMEKMLVRTDMTLQQLAHDYDENDSQKTETRTLEKWSEFMVVARKSHDDDADFRLQMYASRVIPEIESGTVKKHPRHEVRLDPSTARVNLYSSLDKTVVIWHPYRKGTRIMIMRPRSTAHSVEWYTFLREVLGWARPSFLQVNVPDFSVTLRLDKPFEGLEAAQSVEAADEATASAKIMAEEQAVAGKIIKQCIDMLKGDPEWSNVLETWNKTQKMGLAWKRYDRLEWVHGANEQRMYGAMAMSRTHDLELRPKQHYPTITPGKKGKLHDEPPPVEGFLIRLTSQRGVHQRMGKTFFKRLYFSTQDQFLLFNRPAKATPPHPPKLPTVTGTNIPDSEQIIEQTPKMFNVEPYPVNDGEVTWLKSSDKQHIELEDRNAFEESQRNMSNLTECDGYINLCKVEKVREMTWGASVVDDDMDSGSSSDADYHQEVPDTRQDDGTTTKIDDDRTFELLLNNGLVVRLQSYDQTTRNEWMKRLRKLVKYWKLRTTADMDLYKIVRKANLDKLNIDEEMEAIIGQFARKWEVSRSEASPQLFNICSISLCRPISMSGNLYRKPKRHSTFVRCGVILTNGQLLIFSGSMRKRTGVEVPHIHQEKQQTIDLKDCYVYSGLISEDDLLYQNQTFDANHAGMHGLPRVYLDDGWTSSDVDSMTCFVVWQALRKTLFKANVSQKPDGGTRQKLRAVSRLGVPGRSIVFKCRSRAERDHWVLNVGMEIDRLQVDEDVRLETEKKA